MNRKSTFLFWVSIPLILMGCSEVETSTEKVEESLNLKTSTIQASVDYKGSIVSYFGSTDVSELQLAAEAKLIDIADRRFESKWINKDAAGISDEYTSQNAVFMKPGVKPRLGRSEIATEFEKSVQGVDRVVFFQDELQFFGNMDVAFQRCHMLGFIDSEEEHIFEGSYVILWKKENDNWLIEYDMFNSDN